MTVFKNRGIMLDPARLLEKRDYYYELLPWFQKWGYNTLHFHFTDDTSCALVFPSHPELASPGAFTADEMKAFIAKAGEYGLTVIPELESLGHTQFITRHPDYSELGGAQGQFTEFNSLDPENPKVRNLLSDLLKDIVEIFPSQIIHVGLDEVDMSNLPAYKSLSRAEQWKAFANHAQWVHEAVRTLGRRPAMWGDHVLHSPEMADMFGKDVLIFDWHYGAPFDPQSLRFFIEHGFEVWGCPASMQWDQKILPTVQTQFRNLREFSANAMLVRDQGCAGMVNTVWCPWRYLSGVMDLPMALGGHLFSHAEESDRFVVDFVEQFYELTGADAERCAETIWRLHAAAPDRLRYGHLIETPETLTREDQRWFQVMAAEATSVEKILEPLVAKATSHATRLNDYVLTARIMQVAGAFSASGCDPTSVGDLQPLLDACDKSWWSTKDTTWEADSYPYTGTESLLPTLKSMAMAKNPPRITS